MTTHERLGEYRIEKEIGRGGMGVVYLARQESLDRSVALKVLPEGLTANEDYVKRFYREAKAAAKIVHPNVIQVYGVGEHEGTHYFAMEFVEGEDLTARLKREGKLPVKDAIRIAIETGRALQCAHEQGIVHRDIKSSNIMLDRRGTVKVMDFGLAKGFLEATEVTQAGMVIGTVHYMSPEQGSGKRLDTRSDLYSLGVVLFEMLTGRVPFKADTPSAGIYMHIHEPPTSPREFNPEVSESLERVVMRLLAKKPDDRYPEPTRLVEDLERIRDGKITSMTATVETESGEHLAVDPDRTIVGMDPGTDETSTGSRKQAGILAAAVLLLAAGIGFAAWNATRQEKPDPPPPENPVAGPIDTPENPDNGTVQGPSDPPRNSETVSVTIRPLEPWLHLRIGMSLEERALQADDRLDLKPGTYPIRLEREYCEDGRATLRVGAEGDASWGEVKMPRPDATRATDHVEMMIAKGHADEAESWLRNLYQADAPPEELLRRIRNRRAIARAERARDDGRLEDALMLLRVAHDQGHRSEESESLMARIERAIAERVEPPPTPEPVDITIALPQHWREFGFTAFLGGEQLADGETRSMLPDQHAVRLVREACRDGDARLLVTSRGEAFFIDNKLPEPDDARATERVRNLVVAEGVESARRWLQQLYGTRDIPAGALAVLGTAEALASARAAKERGALEEAQRTLETAHADGYRSAETDALLAEIAATLERIRNPPPSAVPVVIPYHPPWAARGITVLLEGNAIADGTTVELDPGTREVQLNRPYCTPGRATLGVSVNGTPSWSEIIPPEPDLVLVTGEVRERMTRGWREAEAWLDGFYAPLDPPDELLRPIRTAQRIEEAEAAVAADDPERAREILDRAHAQGHRNDRTEALLSEVRRAIETRESERQVASVCRAVDDQLRDGLYEDARNLLDRHITLIARPDVAERNERLNRARTLERRDRDLAGEPVSEEILLERRGILEELRRISPAAARFREEAERVASAIRDLRDAARATRLAEALAAAQSTFDAGDWEEAVAAAERAIEEDPGHPDAIRLRDRARVALRLVDLDAAVRNRSGEAYLACWAPAGLTDERREQIARFFDGLVRVAASSMRPERWEPEGKDGGIEVVVAWEARLAVRDREIPIARRLRMRWTDDVDGWRLVAADPLEE